MLATERLSDGTGGYGWLLAGAGAGGLLAVGATRRPARGDRTAGAIGVGMALYTLPLLGFLVHPALAGGLAIEAVRGFGCVVVTASLLAGLQRAVPSVLSGRVFALSHVLALGGTVVGALATPFMLRWLGLSGTLVLAAVGPWLVHLPTLRGLRAFDDVGAPVLTALEPKVGILRELELFHDASRWTLYDLAEHAEELDVAAGTAVVAEGAQADALYVLVDGTVNVSAGADGHRRLLRTLSSPACFGEIGLIHRIARTAIVTTTSNARLWRIPGRRSWARPVRSGSPGPSRKTSGSGYGRGPETGPPWPPRSDAVRHSPPRRLGVGAVRRRQSAVPIWVVLARRAARVGS